MELEESFHKQQNTAVENNSEAGSLFVRLNYATDTTHQTASKGAELHFAKTNAYENQLKTNPERFQLESDRLQKSHDFIEAVNKLPAAERSSVIKVIPWMANIDSHNNAITPEQRTAIQRELSSNPNLLHSFESYQSTLDKIESIKSPDEHKIEGDIYSNRQQLNTARVVEKQETSQRVSYEDVQTGIPGGTRQVVNQAGNKLDIKYDDSGKASSYVYDIKSGPDAGRHEVTKVDGHFVDKDGKCEELGDLVHSNHFKDEKPPSSGSGGQTAHEPRGPNPDTDNASEKSTPAHKPNSDATKNAETESQPTLRPQSYTEPRPQFSENNIVRPGERFPSAVLATSTNDFSPKIAAVHTDTSNHSLQMSNLNLDKLSIQSKAAFEQANQSKALSQSDSKTVSNAILLSNPFSLYASLNSQARVDLQASKRAEQFDFSSTRKFDELIKGHSAGAAKDASIPGHLEKSTLQQSLKKQADDLQQKLERLNAGDHSRDKFQQFQHHDFSYAGTIQHDRSADAQKQIGDQSNQQRRAANDLARNSIGRSSGGAEERLNSRTLASADGASTDGKIKGLNGSRLDGRGLLDDKGASNFSTRKDIIDKIRDQLGNTNGAKNGVKIFGVPGRVIDGTKGSDKSGKTESADKSGRILDKTLRAAQLEDLSLKVIKLPSEVKLSADKIIGRLLNDPKEKFDSKDKALADALGKLSKAELNFIRMILKTGVKPDFSRFTERQKALFILVFKALMEHGSKTNADKLITRTLTASKSADSVSELKVKGDPKAARGMQYALSPEVTTLSLVTRTRPIGRIDTRTIVKKLSDNKNVEGNSEPLDAAKTQGTIQLLDSTKTKELDQQLDPATILQDALFGHERNKEAQQYQFPQSETLAAGVRLIESECFRMDDKGTRISLRLREGDDWKTVCQYDIYSTDSKKCQFNKVGHKKLSHLNLPAPQLKVMAKADFRNNWKNICEEFRIAYLGTLVSV